MGNSPQDESFCSQFKADLFDRVMPERDKIVVIREGHDSLGVLLGNWEQKLENAHHLELEKTRLYIYCRISNRHITI